MSPENYEILDSNNILLIIDVFLFCSHEDVDLIEGKLHMLFFWLYYLDSNCLFVFVIECFDDFTKSATA